MSKLIHVTKPNTIRLIPGVFFCVLLVAALAGVLVLTGGHFAYALDDAYIHLALAEQIARWHYGLNAGEFSSPASSPLWPLLLAPFAATPVGVYLPLLYNVAATLAAVGLWQMLAGDALAGLAPTKREGATALTTIFLTLVTGLGGLWLMGMEHTLQIALALGLIVALARGRARRRWAWWVGLLLVCGPLVRYENLVLTLPALVYLYRRGARKLAVISGGVLVGLLAGFSLFLHSLGLGWLPYSVLTKIILLAPDYGRRITEIHPVLLYGGASVIFVGGAGLWLTRTMWRPRISVWRLAAWGGLVAIAAGQGAQIISGTLGQARYWALLWACAWAGLLCLAGPHLTRLVNRLTLPQWASVLGVGLLTGANFLYLSAMLPLAAANTYAQQGQMHRFLRDYYPAPVAVNDVGFVAYHTDNYIFDLFGLAAPDGEGLSHRPGVEPQMRARAAHYGVHLAMLYEVWFPALPPEWIKLGELHLTRYPFGPADSTVSFFVTDSDTARQVRPLLEKYAASLPTGAIFVFPTEDTIR